MYSLLVKFAKEKQYLEQMQKGLLYCNSIKYFTELEDGKIRGDRYESSVELKYIEKGSMKLKPVNSPETNWKTLNFIDGHFNKNFSNPNGNLFCLSSIAITPTIEPMVFEFDEQLKSLGNYVLLIMDQPVFFKRLKKAIKKYRIKAYGEKVKYLDLKKYSGTKNLFQKDVEYSWQQEFRIFLNRDNNDVFKLSIGDCNDISIIYDLEEQKQFLIKTPIQIITQS